MKKIKQLFYINKIFKPQIKKIYILKTSLKRAIKFYIDYQNQ